MALCARCGRIALCFVFFALSWSQPLAAQDRDRDDRHDGDRNCEGCERKHPRPSPLEYLLLPGFAGARSATVIGIVPNAVTALAFHLDRVIRLGHVAISIVVPDPGSHAYVGIYDDHGNLLVQGKIPTDVAGEAKVKLCRRVWLKPGMYYFAIGAESSAAQALGYLFADDLVNLAHGGMASNPITDGSLPADLGTVSPPIDGSTSSAVFTP